MYILVLFDPMWYSRCEVLVKHTDDMASIHAKGARDEEWHQHEPLLRN